MTRERKRRQYGTGGVHLRSDGRWAGTVEAGYTATGARRRITVYGRTEAEAKTKLKDKQRQISTEGAPTTSARTTVKAWSDEWLAMTRSAKRAGPWATDASAVRRWIVPAIGHRRLEQLSPGDIRSVTDALRAAGRSTSTAHRTHITLTSMLRAAQLEGHPVPERVLKVKPPALAANDRAAMPITEALALLHVASFLPHGSRWAMAFLHGMRQAECLGLTWDCVDLETGIVTVEWQLQALPYIERADPGRGFHVPDGMKVRHLVDGYHLTPPKTRKGFRVIPLVPAMREALTDWKAIAPDSTHGLVWPTTGGRPANDRHDRDEWYALQGTAAVGHPAGRYYFPHEARHTTATQLLEGGVDPKVVTEIMGHSSILTSQGYQHVSRVGALAALEGIAGRLELSPRSI